MPGAERCQRREGCARTLPERGEGTGKTASSPETGFAHFAFVHSDPRAAGSSDARGDAPRGSRGGAEAAGKGAADAQARSSALGGRALAEEPGAPQGRGVKGASGRRGLRGRGERERTGAHGARGPRRCASAPPPSSRAPAHSCGAVKESLVVGLSEARRGLRQSGPAPWLVGNVGTERSLSPPTGERPRSPPAPPPSAPSRPNAAAVRPGLGGAALRAGSQAPEQH